MASPDPSTSLVLQLLLLIVLILINAFFAAAEMSIVSANKNKVKLMAQDGNQKADSLLDLLDEPNTFLSTIQVVITFAGFLNSASAAVGMSDELGALITKVGLPAGNQLAIILVTLILSYVTIVLGELYPKRIALHHSESVALACVKPIMFIAKIVKPFVWIISVSVNLMLRLTRQPVDVSDDEFSEDEVMSMLEVGRETGVLKEEGRKMIDSIFEFDDTLAYEIMTPRTDVFVIDADDSQEEYMDELMELRYSRMPVYEGDMDNIIGILNIKDFLIKAKEVGFENVNIRDILRKPYFVPETKNIDALFFDLQKNKTQIAVLIDEYGGFSGIVTMEDLIEQIVGDIEDEYDEEEDEIQKIDENTYIVDGLTSINQLNEELDLEFESENSETIGGLIIDILGEIPSEESDDERIIEYQNCVFRIMSVKERRIEKVKLCVIPEMDNDEDEDDDEKDD